MRNLGLAASGADDVPKYSQLPSGLFVASAMTTDAAFGTSLTAIPLSAALTPGLWTFELMLSWNVATATNVSYQVYFTGTNSSNQHWIVRVAGTNGLAVEVGRNVNVTYTTSSTTPHTGQIRGTINVTAAGTLGLQMLRAGSTAGSLEKSSYLRAFKV